MAGGAAIDCRAASALVLRVAHQCGFPSKWSASQSGGSSASD
jgi:hypothetical protein